MDPAPFLIIAIMVFVTLQTAAVIAIRLASRKKIEYIELEKHKKPQYLIDDKEPKK